MNRKTGLVLATALVAGVVLVLAVWQFHAAPGPGPASSESGGYTEIVPEMEPDAAEPMDSAPGHPASASSANAQAVVPMNSGDAEQLDAPADVAESYRAEARTRIETALAGDAQVAIQLSQRINACRGPLSHRGTHEGIVSQVRNMAARNSAFSLTEWAAATGIASFMPASGIDSPEAYADLVLDAFDRCEATRDLFGESLRDRLADAAERGSVTARYLYAMWKPISTFPNFQDWNLDIEYQDRALEYTWRNIFEREPLGILALAQSYGMGGNLFTGMDLGTFFVLTVAAAKCGLSVPQLDVQVNRWLRRREENPDRYSDDALVKLNEASDEAASMFCRKPGSFPD